MEGPGLSFKEDSLEAQDQSIFRLRRGALLETTRRDLPPNPPDKGASMTESEPIKKLSGIPPGPVHFHPATGALPMSILSRRFFLGAAAASALPATAAAAAAPALLTPSPMRENRRLLWLGEQLDAVEVAFTAAIARKAEARVAADQQWPQPPAEIVFPAGVREPTWCGVHSERDIDDETFYHFGNRNTCRKVADAWQLERFVSLAGGGGPTDRKNVKAARKLLAIARKYEDAREALIESTGYRQAKQHLYEVGYRFERIASMIYKTPAQTRQGLEIKARALLVGVRIDVIDGTHIGYRSKQLYAEKLANDVLSVMA